MIIFNKSYTIQGKGIEVTVLINNEIIPIAVSVVTVDNVQYTSTTVLPA